ncbi:hypothetical protein acdb102_02700 [Acidothermaceae bacterium B102]|nr:hypothetical protein acdb102_02700 [Acidothermaceae bacterium B102]
MCVHRPPLAEAGWSVQHKRDLNLFAGRGVAVREAIMAAGQGRADYLLYVDTHFTNGFDPSPAGRAGDGLPAAGDPGSGSARRGGDAAAPTGRVNVNR